jgi:hypothetical protein
MVDKTEIINQKLATLVITAAKDQSYCFLDVFIIELQVGTCTEKAPSYN